MDIKYISLGFSCMSRGYGSLVSPDPRALPYDWNITTKEFVLRSLTNLDGGEFTPAVDELSVYEMPDTNQGPYKDGIFFWHDFSREGPFLVPNWREEINYLQKYPFLWERFLKLIKDDAVRKVFIISNAQSNIDQYSSSKRDYSEKFQIDSLYLEMLKQKLDLAGVKNYEFLILFGVIDEFLDVIRTSKLDCIDPRFVGAHWGLNNTIANSLIKREFPMPNAGRIVGMYDNSGHQAEIQLAPHNTFVILNSEKKVWGAAKSYADGYLFSLLRGDSKEADIFTAAEYNGTIFFSNNYNWHKV